MLIQGRGSILAGPRARHGPGRGVWREHLNPGRAALVVRSGLGDGAPGASRPGSPRRPTGGTIGVVRERGGSLTPTTPPPDRRFTDQVSPLATLIGPGACFRGDLRSDHPVEIRGTLEGDCYTSARCVVHEGGRVLGNIDAIALVVAGEVDAGLLKAEKVELRASARVLGVISAGVVVIADGAFFQGEIEDSDVLGGPPVLTDRRKSEPGSSTEP